MCAIGAVECERPQRLVPIIQIVDPGKGIPGSNTVHVNVTSLPGHTVAGDTKLLVEITAPVRMHV